MTEDGTREARLHDLEERVRVLQEENDLLAERGEDILLLGLVAEEINASEDVGAVVDAVLERISILKNIPLCAFCERDGEELVVRNSYLSFANAKLPEDGVRIAPERLLPLESGPLLFRGKDVADIFLWVPDGDFSAHAVFFMPCTSQFCERGVFVFAEDGEEVRLPRITAVLTRIVEMVSVRVENLFLLGELKTLNRELDRKVLERTGDLWNITKELRAEVAEREKTEKHLRESEERFRRLIESAGDGVFVIELESGRIMDVNGQACRSLGYTRDELLNMSLPDVDISFDQDRMLKHHSSLLTSKTVTVEGTHRRKDGTTFPVEVRVGLTEFGGRTHSMALARDLTERKRFEEELLQVQKMESVGRLAGGIAHDFNNLLSTVLGYTELVQLELKDNASVMAKLEMAKAAGHRAADLTRQLLAFGRKQMLRIGAVNLNHAVDGMLKMLIRLIGEDISLKTRLEQGIPDVLADRTQLEQVLMNLVVNARDAMPDGGTLFMETGLVDVYPYDVISLGGMQAGRYATLSVTDTGVGMDQATMEKIFEPFFTTKESEKGTGLGLSTVYGIVKQHSGHIRVYSEPGSGTTFRIYWPVAVGEPMASDQPDEMSTMQRGEETVLVVDDEPSIRQLVQDMLKPLGYHVLAAASAKEALGIMESGNRKVDLLLSDVVMPEHGGGELAEIFVSRFPDVKIIFMSGYPDEKVLRHGLPREGFAFIQKPLTPSGLSSAIRAAFNDT